MCETCKDSLVFYRHTLPMVAANVNMVKKATAYYRPSTLHFRMNNIRIILILITGYATPPFTHPLHSLNKSAKDQHVLKQIVIITNSMGISKKHKTRGVNESTLRCTLHLLDVHVLLHLSDVVILTYLKYV